MAEQNPQEVKTPPSLLTPFASVDRAYIETRHGEIDFSRRTVIMGIVNVTPDSFYDGGRRLETSQAIADGVAMAEAGADILDIGGESTRPGAKPVSEDQELARVLPVVSGLRREANIPISIDTYKSGVARRALDAGADIVNDISALRFDPAMLSLVAAEKIPIVLMHMQGKPQTMQTEPRYQDVVQEVRDFWRPSFMKRWTRHRCGQVILDPGIGFVKRWGITCSCCAVCPCLLHWDNRCRAATRVKLLSAKFSVWIPNRVWRGAWRRRWPRCSRVRT
jgi:dihydropteroate synthase